MEGSWFVKDCGDNRLPVRSDDGWYALFVVAEQLEA
jgi:hypothetical protein